MTMLGQISVETRCQNNGLDDAGADCDSSTNNKVIHGVVVDDPRSPRTTSHHDMPGDAAEIIASAAASEMKRHGAMLRGGGCSVKAKTIRMVSSIAGEFKEAGREILQSMSVDENAAGHKGCGKHWWMY